MSKTRSSTSSRQRIRSTRPVFTIGLRYRPTARQYWLWSRTFESFASRPIDYIIPILRKGHGRGALPGSPERVFKSELKSNADKNRRITSAKRKRLPFVLGVHRHPDITVRLRNEPGTRKPPPVLGRSCPRAAEASLRTISIAMAHGVLDRVCTLSNRHHALDHTAS
jgi:hypothetical protein